MIFTIAVAICSIGLVTAAQVPEQKGGAFPLQLLEENKHNTIRLADHGRDFGCITVIDLRQTLDPNAPNRNSIVYK
eukprot:Pgem_evm1s13967